MTKPMTSGACRLVLLRHGQSEWNARNWFTGWPDVVHTSLQQRAIRTAELALAACDQDWIPVRRSWRLNSNHYGTLQGRKVASTRTRVVLPAAFGPSSARTRPASPSSSSSDTP
jgi:bisphosphoglycerate-dependent phosphoglycerate mutase